MPVSAYDQSGRLKKHALAGTSLAVDPDRAEQRSQFQELHKEARTAGAKGRETMVNTLTDRYKKFGNPQMERLSEIAEQKQGFETQAAGLRDRKLEQGFAEYTKNVEADQKNKVYKGRNLHMPDEVLQGAKTKLDEMSWEERKEWADNRDMYATDMGYKALGQGLGQGYRGAPGSKMAATLDKQYWKKQGGKKRREYYQGKMATQMYDEKYGAAKQRAYEENFNKEVDRINESYIPLQEEEGQRQERLADRAELYNLFVGG